MKKNFKKSNLIELAAVIIAFVFIILYIGVCLNGKDISFNFKSLDTIDSWIYSFGESSGSLSLPQTLNCGVNEVCSISTILGDEFSQEKYILFNGNHCTFTAYLDDEIIYEASDMYGTTLTKAAGSLWYLIPIPDDSSEKTLTISFSWPYSRYCGDIKIVNYGSYNEILFEILRTNFIPLLISLIIAILVIGVCLCAIIVRVSHQITRNMLYLSWFAIDISFWFFSESHMTQFLISSEFLASNLSYLSLMTALFPMILLLKSSYKSHGVNLLNIALIITGVSDIIQLLLQYFRVLDLCETLSMTHVSMLCSVSLILASLIKETRFFHNEDALREFHHILVFAMFCMFEMVNFYIGAPLRVSVITGVGVVYYTLSRANVFVHQIVEMKNELRMARKEATLAYVDQLTGGNNRMAFYRDFDRCFECAETPIYLLMFDLNNLKIINDNYGHHSGDVAIKSMYECMEKAFGKYGTCYRIGGDEFTCLISNQPDINPDSLIEKFHKLTSEADQTYDFPFSAAVGYAKADAPLIMTQDELTALADAELYHNKRKMKKIV